MFFFFLGEGVGRGTAAVVRYRSASLSRGGYIVMNHWYSFVIVVVVIVVVRHTTDFFFGTIPVPPAAPDPHRSSLLLLLLLLLIFLILRLLLLLHPDGVVVGFGSEGINEWSVGRSVGCVFRLRRCRSFSNVRSFVRWFDDTIRYDTMKRVCCCVCACVRACCLSSR